MSPNPVRPSLSVSSGIFSTSEHFINGYSLLKENGFVGLEIGYEHVGPALSDEVEYHRLLALTEISEPPLSSIHAPYRPDRDISMLGEKESKIALKNNIRALDLAVELNISLVVLHCSELPIGPGERQRRLKQAHRRLSDLVGEARDRRLRLAVEFLPPEWLGATLDEVRYLIEDLDPAWIGCCLDTNHANLSGDLVDIVRGLKEKLWHIHISDNDEQKQQHWMPLTGVINWSLFMKALAETGYDGALVYELDPFPEGPEFALNAVSRNYNRLMQCLD